MKALLLISVLSFSSFSMAAATCPSTLKTMMTCTSTPQRGDSEVAAGILDSVAACYKGNAVSMVVQKGPESSIGSVQMEYRAGGTTITMNADDTAFTWSYPTGIVPSTTWKAKFSVIFKKAATTVSSTYTCTRPR
jgi:hypothetical protein